MNIASRIEVIDTLGWPIWANGRIRAAIEHENGGRVTTADIQAARRFGADCGWFDHIDVVAEPLPSEASLIKQVCELIDDDQQFESNVIIWARDQWVAFAGTLLTIDLLREDLANIEDHVAGDLASAALRGSRSEMAD
jgi:hypothetical protein